MGNMPWGIFFLIVFFFYQGLREAPAQAEEKMRDTTKTSSYTSGEAGARFHRW